MEFRNQDDDIAAQISSSLNYNHNSIPNQTPNLAHTPIRFYTSSPRPSPTSATNTSSRNGHHQHDPTPQITTKFQSSPSTSTTNANNNNTITYHECLKNHAAALGGQVLDGCGEFMPDPDNSLRCAACSCHRSFHRKDFANTSHISSTNHASIPLLLPPTHNPYTYQARQFQSGLSGGTTTESSSEERVGTGSAVPTHTSSKKRYRTKFTPEQKEKMLAFAERVGWRIQKQDEHLVEQFCNEVGVRRQVLKVWMHNNKQNGRKKEHMQQSQHEEEVHL